MTTTETPVDNGVNVEALLGVRDALPDAPEIAQFQWRSTTSWVNGTHSRSDVETFYGFGEEQRHRSTFSYDVDHPLQFAAQDNGVTPVEYVLVALGGCLTAGIAAVAQQRSIQLRSVKATLAAEMDLHGILGADPEVRNGFSGVTVSYVIDADATAEESQGAGRAVAEAFRGLRHPDQPDQRHRRRGLIRHLAGEAAVADTTTVVVGAGHCGLAMSRCLADRSIDHVVLERGEVANSWRTQRWDSLRLLTPNWMTRLPGFAYRGDDPDGYMTAPQVARLIADYADGVGRAGAGQHHRHLDPAARRRVPGADRPGHLARSDGRARQRCQRASPTCRSGWRRTCQPGSPRSARPTTATPPSCRTAGCWWSARRPAGFRSRRSCTAPAGRSPSPSASTSGCRGLTGAATSCGGWTPRACSTSATTRFPTCLRARNLPSMQLVGTPERATLDLNALRTLGVRLVGRLAGIQDGTALFSGSLPNVCALADLKLGRLLDTIDGWAARAGVGGDQPPQRFAPTEVPTPVPLSVDLRARRDRVDRLGHRLPAGPVLAARPGVRPQGPGRA